MSGRYLLVEDVASLLGSSVRTVQERATAGRIPHRRIGGTRRLLFLPDEFALWIDSAGALELETVSTPNGGRAVRPKGAKS